MRPWSDLMDRLLVRFGCEIFRRVPGRVSTEVDAPPVVRHQRHRHARRSA